MEETSDLRPMFIGAIKMWRPSTQLRTTAALWRFSSSTPNLRRSIVSSTTAFYRKTPLFFLAQLPAKRIKKFCNVIDNNLRKKIEDIMPIATGHELQELEAEVQGMNILETNHPVVPFGNKEAPAVVKSVYDKRKVGYPGVHEEDDIVWFWLEKDRPHECPVCSQHFRISYCVLPLKLKVVGAGGSPDGH